MSHSELEEAADTHSSQLRFMKCASQPLLKILTLAVLAGLMAGVEAGNIILTQSKISESFELTYRGCHNLITASILGATFGAVGGGFLADLYGRKFALVLFSMALLPTALSATVSESFSSLLVERFLTAAISIADVAASMAYTFELAPTRRRSAPVAIIAAAAVGGWIAVCLAASHANKKAMENHGWRIVGGGTHLMVSLFYCI